MLYLVLMKNKKQILYYKIKIYMLIFIPNKRKNKLNNLLKRKKKKKRKGEKNYKYKS